MRNSLPPWYAPVVAAAWLSRNTISPVGSAVLPTVAAAIAAYDDAGEETSLSQAAAAAAAKARW